MFASSYQGPTGTRYPTRPDNFWQYPIRTRFFFRIIGYFGYQVFHLFWPDVPVTLLDIHVGQYCFNPHNLCQVWTCHQSSLQRIQSMKSYNRDVGTARYKILPIIWHCALFARIISSFQEICSLVTHLCTFVVIYFRQLFCFYCECIW